jgi:hypothetical protein
MLGHVVKDTSSRSLIWVGFCGRRQRRLIPQPLLRFGGAYRVGQGKGVLRRPTGTSAGRLEKGLSEVVAKPVTISENWSAWKDVL